ncbi:Gfo/Idh/MocA family protein [Gryllotalpicola protaetiae]|uniref:Gfo/Idh/MocA family oxidoreductase n=1 Tax=Gryllotalpicola protaetiae TaxID=2419771 RepID=A0A387BRD7_9MICO|nr:Gfo/Idh/MocA family oxidoreductase [Gryllotalpicola protaetiae]AYG03630.1 gfo/Idh/MocA family oxidoreductase [Gryllotalpicola protaetiae]
MTDTHKLRWGVIGTGNIAHRFATDLSLSAVCELGAVGSRDAARARAFAERCGAARWFADHDELMNSPEIDAIYIAVPHSAHHELAARAIETGKPVLVEKPFTINQQQADDLIGRARDKGSILMEAMWTRFLPHMVRVRELLAEQYLGELRLVTAEHGVWFAHNTAHRMFDPHLGGGALLDLGVYPISFASMVLGSPATVVASSQFGDTGVDGQTAVTFGYSDGRQAVVNASMQTWLSNRATIAGTDARIDFDPTWYRPTSFTVTRRDGRTERFEFPVEGFGLRFQAEEIARLVREGRTDSDIMPLAESSAIMGTMDEVRRQIGLSYPGE